MKTKRVISKKRQEIARQLTVWTKRINELEHKLKAEEAEGDGLSLEMCQDEARKCTEALLRLGTRQRSWASGKLGLKK